MNQEFHLAEPAWLLLIGLALLPWVWERRRSGMAWPAIGQMATEPGIRGGVPRWLPPLLRSLALAALALGLARPQTVVGAGRRTSSGVAIVLALDVSSSMATTALTDQPGSLTRLEAARESFRRFVAGRPDDLIGLVAFAKYPDTTCPPTLDHEFLLECAAALRPARPSQDGTNIGDALAWATRDVIGTSARRKAVLLLTDGRNEPGVAKPLDPVEAARLARALDVTVHVIALESAEMLNAGEDLQASATALLQQVANDGGGELFLVGEGQDLSQVFDRIDQLEKSRITSPRPSRYREWWPALVAAALSLVGLEAVLLAGRWRRWP